MVTVKWVLITQHLCDTHKAVCEEHTIAPSIIDAAPTRADNNFEPVSGVHFEVHLDEVDCAGTEERLVDCPHNPIDDCSHPEDAGVVCQGKWVILCIDLFTIQFLQNSAPTCSDGDVRLTAGPIWKEGRVEVCQNNTWWSLCNEGFDENAATAICKQLYKGFFNSNPCKSIVHHVSSELQYSS